MKSSITFRPLARQDVLEQMLYLEEQANEETALRYHDAVLATCRMLAEHPLSGKSLKREQSMFKIYAVFL